MGRLVIVGIAIFFCMSLPTSRSSAICRPPARRNLIVCLFFDSSLTFGSESVLINRINAATTDIHPYDYASHNVYSKCQIVNMCTEFPATIWRLALSPTTTTTTLYAASVSVLLRESFLAVSLCVVLSLPPAGRSCLASTTCFFFI
jgi:hypothetical protein